MPLVPSALALWAINFIDREFIIWYKGAAEVGVYSVAIKVASIITFVMVAFRTAWPAFAYSIEDDREARRTYSFVLTYLLCVRVVGRARARRARAVVGRAADEPALPARAGGGRAARVRVRDLRGLHRARHRQRPRAEDAVQLGRDRRRRRRERRAELLADPALGNGRRGDLDARRRTSSCSSA